MKYREVFEIYMLDSYDIFLHCLSLGSLEISTNLTEESLQMQCEMQKSHHLGIGEKNNNMQNYF